MPRQFPPIDPRVLTGTTLGDRFRGAVEAAVGSARAQEIEDCIEGLDRSDDAGRLAALLKGHTE